MTAQRRSTLLGAAGAVLLSALLALCLLAVLTPTSVAAVTPNCSRDAIQNPDADPDGDYLTNQQECRGRFDADWWDTDDDGLGDAYEDNDGDNLKTHEEFKAGFDPLKAESDATAEFPLGDGIRDDYEDTDRDGLDTWEEFRARATLGRVSCASKNFSATEKPRTTTFDPRNADSYTIVDGTCARNGTLDGREDIDKDTRLTTGMLTTAEEFDLNWDPNDRDTDDDGIWDGDEAGPGSEEGRAFKR